LKIKISLLNDNAHHNESILSVTFPVDKINLAHHLFQEVVAHFRKLEKESKDGSSSEYEYPGNTRIIN